MSYNKGLLKNLGTPTIIKKQGLLNNSELYKNMKWTDRLFDLLVELSEPTMRQAQLGAEMRKKAIQKKLDSGDTSPEVRRNLRSDLIKKTQQANRFKAGADRAENKRVGKATDAAQRDIENTRDQSRVKHSARVDLGATHDRQGRPLSHRNSGGSGRVVDNDKVKKDVAAARKRGEASVARERETSSEIRNAPIPRFLRAKSTAKRYKAQLGGGGVSRAEKARLRKRFGKK